MSEVKPAHRPVEEIRNEFCRISEELHAAEKAEAMEKYGDLVGKWVYTNERPWNEDDAARDIYYNKNLILVDGIQHVVEVASGIDTIYVTSRYTIEMLASIVGGLTTRTAVADRDEHFDSNRFKIVDEDFVLTTLNKSVINFTDRVVEIQKAVKELNK
jgi:hypothetical protein